MKNQIVFAKDVQEGYNAFIEGGGIATFLWVKIENVEIDDLQVHLSYYFQGRYMETSYWHNSKIKVSF